MGGIGRKFGGTVTPVPPGGCAFFDHFDTVQNTENDVLQIFYCLCPLCGARKHILIVCHLAGNHVYTTTFKFCVN